MKIILLICMTFHDFHEFSHENARKLMKIVKMFSHCLEQSRSFQILIKDFHIAPSVFSGIVS